MGSQIIGQAFSGAAYFHSRPSAAGYGYQADNSNGRTGTHQSSLHRPCEDGHRCPAGGKSNTPVPIDLVTTSAPGLDPDITPAAAAFQVARVAKARGVSEDDRRSLVAKYTQGRQFGFLGEARVNVLLLNLELTADFQKLNLNLSFARLGCAHGKLSMALCPHTPSENPALTLPPTHRAD